MFAIGTNMRRTSHGLLPRAEQIFAHIMMLTTMFTKGMKNKISIQVAMPATCSNGTSCTIGIQIRMPGWTPHFSQIFFPQKQKNR